MSDYPMLISNKLHSFRNFMVQNSLKHVPLQRVFHSIRFKVNKGWSKALLLFLCLHFPHT